MDEKQGKKRAGNCPDRMSNVRKSLHKSGIPAILQRVRENAFYGIKQPRYGKLAAA